MGESAENAWVARRIGVGVREAGLTLKELGDRMGVSRPTIYAYASGTLRVSRRRLEQIAQILGKDVKYFLNENYDDNPNRFSDAVSIIDALLSPPDPVKAGTVALEWIARTDSDEGDAVRGEFQRRAGNALMLQGNYVEAVAHLTEARALFGAANETERAAACSQSLGYCLINIGRLSAARGAFEESLRDAEPKDQWKGRVSLAALAEREGEFDQASADLADLSETVEDGSIAQTYVLANQAALMCAQMIWPEVLEPAQQALALASRHQLLDQRIEMMGLCGYALLGMGREGEASGVLLRATDLATGAKDHARQVWLDVAWGRLFIRIGEFADARMKLNLSLAQATRSQYRRSVNGALLALGELALAEGDPNQAITFLLQAQADARAYQYPVADQQASSFLAIAFQLAGHSAEAMAQLPSPKGTGEPAYHRALAEYLITKNEPARKVALVIAQSLNAKPLEVRVGQGDLPESQVLIATNMGVTVKTVTGEARTRGASLMRKQ